MGEFTREPYCDPIIRIELLKVRERVLNKDRDFVAAYDGEEGVGKSVLAQQHALILDPNFTIDNIVFTSDAFIKKIKDPKTKKGTCIVLDEAFSAANSRGALTEVNRSMIGLATEMRQKNLFILLVLPSFFDLDRYFALWRCRALFHLYFTPEEDRHYIVFNKESKKLLYLLGKKFYDYNKPKAPFPPAKFFNQYVVNEEEYRFKKSEAFRKRTVSGAAKRWLDQRNACVQTLVYKHNYDYQLLNNMFKEKKVSTISERAYRYIKQEERELNEEEIDESPNE
jgi:hypothetical protein